MLSKQCSIYDIDDIEAFIIMCIKRSGAKPLQSEWEDLIAEGLYLLWAMSERYDTTIGCFSGYALKYMPRKLKHYYMSTQEHCVLRTKPDKSREWSSYARPVSWEQVTSNHSEGGQKRVLHEERLRKPGDFVQPKRGAPTVRES